jgi:hypothetical protein
MSQMDSLTPLIDLAAADGTISAAEFDRLILEAKMRGVSEVDARAYLSDYAAARGWRLGQVQAASVRATPIVSPARFGQSPPQSKPVEAPRTVRSLRGPKRAFRWIAASAVGFAAIVAIAVVVWVRERPPPRSPPPVVATTPAPIAQPAPTATPAPDAAALAAARQGVQIAREQLAYGAARGNLSALQAYVNTCTVCAYQVAARSEIATLQTAQEERTYNAARGNQQALQAYVNTCSVCAFASPARSEIASLEAARPKRHAGSSVICGRTVDYVVDATGVADPYRAFLGVWTGATWNSRICGGLIVAGADNNGTARIIYVYGPLAGSNFSWKQQNPPAVIRDGQLTFQDEEAGKFSFRLNAPNILQGHFTSAHGVALDAVLTKDLSSVPP